ncbi:hypothetical protein [Actinomadura monticuli]|uniref:Uncharacterized protein n=1 Tax=Actinomadura monticuli TaxID=3097367 RepID=A0ABV4Q715_9ACTN
MSLLRPSARHEAGHPARGPCRPASAQANRPPAGSPRPARRSACGSTSAGSGRPYWTVPPYGLAPYGLARCGPSARAVATRWSARAGTSAQASASASAAVPSQRGVAAASSRASCAGSRPAVLGDATRGHSGHPAR